MIVVTGASGFIGANLIRQLNRSQTAEILAVDDYPFLRGRDTFETSPQAVRYAHRFSVKGFLDWHDLPDWLARHGETVEGVIHLGACSDTTVTDRDWIMEVNFECTRRLWQWSTSAHCPFVYASSAATYGDGSQGYDDRVDPSRYHPLNYYGESKHRFDLWALRQPDAPPRWAGLKYFNVYGPGEDHKGRMASVVYHAFHQIRRTGRVQLFQSHRPDVEHGGQQRDFVFVEDVVAATLHFLRTPPAPHAPNGLYNVGTGRARRFEELALATFAALNRPPAIDYIPMPLDLRDKYQYWTQACVEKLRRAGFIQPFLPLEEGVRRYVNEYLIKEAWAA